MKKKVFLLQKKNIMSVIILLLFWVVLSPNITIEALIIGLLVSVGVAFYSKDIIFSEEEVTLYKFSNLIKFLSFIWCLIVEIVKANIQVVKIVLSPSLPISPKMVRVPVKLKKDFNKVLYGNAITLTPGTLTVDIDEDYYLIHALTEEAGDDLVQGSVMEDHIMGLEVDNK